MDYTWTEFWYDLIFPVCYTAVFSIVTQPFSLRDDTKNGCVAD